MLGFKASRLRVNSSFPNQRTLVSLFRGVFPALMAPQEKLVLDEPRKTD
jgi:hypothetical protein